MMFIYAEKTIWKHLLMLFNEYNMYKTLWFKIEYFICNEILFEWEIVNSGDNLEFL